MCTAHFEARDLLDPGIKPRGAGIVITQTVRHFALSWQIRETSMWHIATKRHGGDGGDGGGG